MNIPSAKNQRVVIIGGGFGGLNLAKGLRNKGFQVVLLDRHNYHAFQPLFYQVATAGLEPGSIAYPFRKIFSKYSDYYFRMANVLRIDTSARTVNTDIGTLPYDYLVIATGATTNFFGNKQLEQLCMPMKSISEALDIRSLMLQNLEKALLTNNADDKDSLMGIVIVGGGPTGVELAGALAELKKDILPKDYPDLDMRVMDIHLLDSNDRLLKAMSEKTSAKAQEALLSMGVDIRLGTRVTDYDGKEITTKSGEKLRAAMVIWAAGVKAAYPDGLPTESTSSGRILVDAFNRVKGLDQVFAIGDCAAMISEENPLGHPMMAQPALQQGALLADNLDRFRNGQQPVAFHYKNLGAMATIGRNKAVTELPGFNLYGWIAWVAWLFVHVAKLIGFRNKIVVMISWAQNYLSHSRDLRLIIRPFKR
ncbi:MAG: NAD(P)/FAD-dependent oxidoreductase [Flavobacteriales bacterium]|nr:NAD(P)/FAD-dependent oxidoreductase [Flavobacteriales bacterium]